jgi:hypothetical protein
VWARVRPVVGVAAVVYMMRGAFRPGEAMQPAPQIHRTPPSCTARSLDSRSPASRSQDPDLPTAVALHQGGTAGTGRSRQCSSRPPTFRGGQEPTTRRTLSTSPQPAFS